jgi:pyridoxine 5-phosphate synthase
MSIRLHINIDHVATLRNARGTIYPDPIFAAAVCEQAGADGITAHLREDRRHMVDRDIEVLREKVTTFLNLEMAATDEMVEVALRVRPDAATLVPERREERTTEGGLEVAGDVERIKRVCGRLAEAGIKPSLFIAPDPRQIEASRRAGAHQIELHTGEYCDARSRKKDELGAVLAKAAKQAADFGFEVAAGHGLSRHNVVEVAAIGEIVELNIGHSVIADAVFVGLDRAVRDMRVAIERGIALR